MDKVVLLLEAVVVLVLLEVTGYTLLAQADLVVQDLVLIQVGVL
jgi:hypothetical protein